VFEPVIIADLVDEFGEERLSGGFGSSGKWLNKCMFFSKTKILGIGRLKKSVVNF
jgi:hypothetical protein